MIYTWKEGHSRETSAQEVGDVIAKLEKKEGVARPIRLVDEARPEKSPLHSLFEWNDALAAESFRTDQARSLIANIRIVDEQDQASSFPAFVSVSVADGADEIRGYKSTIDSVESPILRKQVLSSALAQLNGLRKRYESLTELQDVWQSVDKLQEELIDT